MIKQGKKVLIVNDPSQVTFLYFAILASGVKNLVETSDDFQNVAAYDRLSSSPDTQDAEGSTFAPATQADNSLVAQADMLRIVGFGDFVGAQCKKAIGAKGILPQAQVSTLTFTVNSVTVGDEVEVDFVLTSSNFEGDFASHLSDYRLKRKLVLVVSAGETATTLAAKLVTQINNIIESGWQAYFTATSSGAVVTLTGTNGSVSFTASVVSGSGVVAGRVSAVHSVTTGAYAGRNSYDQMKAIKLQTDGNTFPWSVPADSAQIPLKGAKYSSYRIIKTVERADLPGAGGAGLNVIPKGDFEFEIFLNEATCSTLISHLTAWLNANVAVREMWTATAANTALAAESPTTASVVDSTSPFTTPLV